MMSIEMPEKVSNAIHKIFSEIPDQLSLRESEASQSIIIKVAEHPEKDCEYALNITLDWDLPDPGQLLCYLSVGIWNPPVPEDSVVTTPFITADEDSYHPLIFRYISIPAVVAEVSKEKAREIMGSIIKVLMPQGVRFNSKHFNHESQPTDVNPDAFSGTISHKGEYVSWDQWIEKQTSLR